MRLGAVSRVESGMTATPEAHMIRGRCAAVVVLALAASVGAFGTSEAVAASGELSPVVSGFSTEGGRGFWIAYPDGGTYATGRAHSYDLAIANGFLAVPVLNGTVAGGASTSSGLGYWLTATDGGVLSYGDAQFYGSMGAAHLNQPVLGIAPTKDSKGYWLVAADGGVFSFGDAHFYGSTGDMSLNQPVVGITTSAAGQGYRLVARDGGIFSFGDARFYGSLPGLGVSATDVVGMAATPTKAGYWITRSDGDTYAFGDAHNFGNYPASACDPVAAIIANPHAQGYRLVTQSGATIPFGHAPGSDQPTSTPVQCPGPNLPSRPLGGPLTLDGQIGTLQLGVSREADVVAQLGLPNETSIGNIDVGDPDYRTLDYNCPRDRTTAGQACYITYYINLKTQTLAGFDTTSNQYQTAEGTRVGMSSTEAAKREEQPPLPEACLAAGIQLAQRDTRGNAEPPATIVIYVGTQPTDTVTELTAEDPANAIGLMEC
jgi:hypothetical protein